MKPEQIAYCRFWHRLGLAAFGADPGAVALALDAVDGAVARWGVDSRAVVTLAEAEESLPPGLARHALHVFQRTEWGYA